MSTPHVLVDADRLPRDVAVRDLAVVNPYATAAEAAAYGERLDRRIRRTETFAWACVALVLVVAWSIFQ